MKHQISDAVMQMLVDEVTADLGQIQVARAED